MTFRESLDDSDADAGYCRKKNRRSTTEPLATRTEADSKDFVILTCVVLIGQRVVTDTQTDTDAFAIAMIRASAWRTMLTPADAL